ncbi:MAG: hypothetical protein L0170_12595 [Acidobacteria bacterium]|nr:hypothetical protein [Acidobacteriota bacterium]
MRGYAFCCLEKRPEEATFFQRPDLRGRSDYGNFFPEGGISERFRSSRRRGFQGPAAENSQQIFNFVTAEAEDFKAAH